MLMQEATPEMIEQWKSTWNEYKCKLRPNKKSGNEIIAYITNKYPLRELTNDKRAERVVRENVLCNEVFAEKLPVGEEPFPIAFIVEHAGQGINLYELQDEMFVGNDIFVGVDITSGFYCVEGSSLLWDELCAFQGLDEKDIENYYCVAEYVSCLKKFSLLDAVLAEAINNPLHG